MNSLFFWITLLLSGASSCRTEEPKADPAKEKPLFKHALVVDSLCTSCHAKDRPGPFLTHPHGGGKECGECHIPQDENKQWLPRRPFDHNPMPTACFDCHIKERPKPPHPEEGECAGCHTYPEWK